MSGRPIITVRVSPEGLAAVDEMATREGYKGRSDAVRLMLGYAVRTMPQGWRPDWASIRPEETKRTVE